MLVPATPPCVLYFRSRRTLLTRREHEKLYLELLIWCPLKSANEALLQAQKAAPVGHVK